MKSLHKYCQAVLFPLLLSSSFFAVADSGITISNSENKPVKQSVTPTPQGKLIWADLYTGDVEASIKFYTETFGWTVKDFGSEHSRYHLLYDGLQPLAGVLARPSYRNDTESALWIGSIATDNVKAHVERATENKATILLQPHDFALYGKRAVIADAQGGVIALLDLDEKNEAHKNISQRWDWAQLFSINTRKAAAFYEQTFNYQVERVVPKKSSFYLQQQGEVRASIVKLPPAFEQRDRWVNFILVDSLQNTLTKAEALGADIIHKADDGSLAIIADPQGALLGLMEEEIQ